MATAYEQARTRALWAAWLTSLGAGTTLFVIGLLQSWGQDDLGLWIVRWMQICIGLDVVLYAILRPIWEPLSIDWIDGANMALAVLSGLGMVYGALFYGWAYGAVLLLAVPTAAGMLVGGLVAFAAFVWWLCGMFWDILCDLRRSLRVTQAPAQPGSSDAGSI